jgi:hypothetical protein
MEHIFDAVPQELFTKKYDTRQSLIEHIAMYKWLDEIWRHKGELPLNEDYGVQSNVWGELFQARFLPECIFIRWQSNHSTCRCADRWTSLKRLSSDCAGWQCGKVSQWCLVACLRTHIRRVSTSMCYSEEWIRTMTILAGWYWRRRKVVWHPTKRNLLMLGSPIHKDLAQVW